MRTGLSFFALGGAALVLAGCNTLTPETPPGWEPHEDANLALSASDTSAQALADGQTLSAYSAGMSSSLAVVRGDSARSADTPGFAISANANGGYDVTVNGHTTTFTADELSDWANGWEDADAEFGYADAHTYYAGSDLEGFLAGEADGPTYVQLWKYWWDASQTDDYDGARSGYAVVGTETHPDYIDGQDATASYSGFANLVIFTNDGSQEIGMWTQGDDEFSLNANFSDSTLSGSITDLMSDAGAVDGTINLESGTIADNGFSGAVSADAAFVGAVDTAFGTATGDLSGEYGGLFFGPEADEVGGTFSISSDGAVGVGGFIGEKN